MCGAKHAGSGAACVKKCIEGGMAPVFVDEDKKAVWTIDNPDAVKGSMATMSPSRRPPTRTRRASTSTRSPQPSRSVLSHFAT